MYSLWKFFLTKRNFSYLLLGSLIIAGLFSLSAIPKESAPEVRIPVGIVSTVLPGASAIDVETLVTNKIEDALSGNLKNVDKITSVSRENVSIITVQFNSDADLDKSIQDLKDKVDRVKSELPDEANDPIVSDVDFVNQPIYTFSIGSEISEEELNKLADSLEEDLKQVQGVSTVSVVGKRDRQVSVIARKEALASFGLGLTDIVNALSRANAELPVGSIELDGVNYGIQFKGDIKDPNEIQNLPILSKNGHAIYVRDVADVIVGLSKQSSISRVSADGKPSEPSLSVAVFKRTGGNIANVTDAVGKRLEELQKPGELLEGVTVNTTLDSGEELRKSLFELTRTGIEAIVLVMIVLFLTVGWREALVAGSSIPISFVIAFIGLNYSGNTLNFVSLFSLILAMGILVDAGIVVVESMYTFVTKGNSPKESAFLAVKTYQAPLTAGIMATVLMFFPLFFISGIVGQFIATIPFTIIFVLLASLFVALVFVPVLGVSFLSTEEKGHAGHSWQDEWFYKLQNWYVAFLTRIFANRRLQKQIILVLAIGFFVSPLFPISGLVKVIFFPGEDVDYVIVEDELPQGTALSRTDLEMRKIEEFLYDEPDIAAFSTSVGASSEFSNNPTADTKFGNIFINLKKDRKMTSSEMVEHLREKLAGINTSEIRVSEPSGGPPVGTPIVIKFRGDDLDAINSLADQSARILRSIKGTANVTASTKDSETEFVLTIDKAKAISLGIDPSTVAFTLRAAVNGTKATSIKTSGNDIDIVVSANLNPNYVTPEDTTKTTIDSIQNMQIASPNGPVLLGTLLSTKLDTASAAITHDERKRVATAASDLSATGNTAEINAEFKKRAATELDIPAGVIMTSGGETEETDKSFSEMGYALLAGLVLMLAVLMFEFNSWRHSFYVLSGVPLTLIGIMIGLALTRLPLSFPSVLGVIALAGIIVNHTILLLDVINHLRREHPDKNITDLVIEGSSIRLRPIALTNITTIIGMFPLAFTGGLWAPLATAIIFGLSFAAVITLLLIPILYNLWPGVLHD